MPIGILSCGPSCRSRSYCGPSICCCIGNREEEEYYSSIVHAEAAAQAEAPRLAFYVRKLYGWLAADYQNFRSQYQPDIDYENC